MVDRDSIAAVDLALKVLGCSQKELAVRLGVSPTQISKWKKGEYISSDMENKISALTNIGELRPSVVMWAGSTKAAKQWTKLLLHDILNSVDLLSLLGNGPLVFSGP